jgi:ferrous iron transport protein A
VKQESLRDIKLIEGCCAGPEVCPLTRVKAGSVVSIRSLSTTPEMCDRLRELGFCEDQKIKLLARDSSYICQVCNARLGISSRLAEVIMVEPVGSGGKTVRNNDE